MTLLPSARCKLRRTPNFKLPFADYPHVDRWPDSVGGQDEIYADLPEMPRHRVFNLVLS